MSKITTHVLDTVLGKPAAGIQVRLQKLEQDHWSDVATAETDQDGRCGNLASNTSAGILLPPGARDDLSGDDHHFSMRP
jgi:5-hydroxyisourate hydrolase-like protein (transthyretin family)